MALGQHSFHNAGGSTNNSVHEQIQAHEGLMIVRGHDEFCLFLAVCFCTFSNSQMMENILLDGFIGRRGQVRICIRFRVAIVGRVSLHLIL
jgi:hypothetical protein